MKRDAEEICLQHNITDDDLKQICKRYLVKEGYDFRKFWINAIHFEDFPSKPFRHLGYHLKLTVRVSPKSISFWDDAVVESSTAAAAVEDDEQKLSFFVKLLPLANERQANFAENIKIFEKETELFQFLIPRLQDIAIGAREWAAQSYLSKDDKVLILENLRREGFQVPLNCDQGLMDVNHVMVATTVLARFHASSIILEDRCREPIPKLYPHSLDETAYPEAAGQLDAVGLENAIAALVALVECVPKYRHDVRACDVIRRRLPEVIRQIVQFVKPSSKYRNVFSHGDLWISNFLFLYDEAPAVDYDSSDESNTESCAEEPDDDDAADAATEDDISVGAETVCAVLPTPHADRQPPAGARTDRSKQKLKPVDGRLVDFQLSRYAPPALDLATFVYMCTTRETRQRHLDAIYENYYENLALELDRLGLSVHDELPRDTFDESIRHYSQAGMIEACLFSHVTLLSERTSESLFSDPDTFGRFIESPHVRSQVCAQNFEADPVYRRRMTDLLIQLVDQHILEVTAL